MNCSACRTLLHEHTDSSLATDVESHLAICADCRAELASLRALRTATAQLPRELTPERDLWPVVAAQLPTPAPIPFPVRHASLLWKLAACFVLFAIGALWFTRTTHNAPAGPAPASWAIATLAGTPRLDTKTFQGTAQLHVGQWLETDATSRAQVSVGAIGEVKIAPNSKVRLVSTSSTDHRLELARGQLSALIWAPPRLFFVETPSATAIDLGCAYTLDVDDNGVGTLHVTSGYVALQKANRETTLSAGQMCLTVPGIGPGTPFADDAPASLRDALRRFDFAKTPTTALADILAAARPADAATLFALIAASEIRSERSAIFSALAALHAPPAGVTREGILSGDATMRRAWADSAGLSHFDAR